MREQRAIRRALAQDPICFAVIYLGGHLLGKPDENGIAGPISFSQVHFQWAALGLTWVTPPQHPTDSRHAFIAPRSTGKSTWWYLILPLWAAANGHVKFAVAFTREDKLAKGHLQSLKTELDTNVLLRADFPDLCEPARKQTGSTLSDRQGMYHAKSGFVFAANGLDGSNLGLKVGSQRPDLIICDDIEPDEARYSPDLKIKRLGTLLDAILPLNIYARVVLSGTVTMPGSICHEIVKAAQGVEVARWITGTGMQCHWHDAIVLDDDGVEHSVWPEKWSIDFLRRERDDDGEVGRAYAKNMANDPMGRTGDFWNRNDFRHGDLGGITHVGLFIDPAVTARKTSDFTGLAVVGYSYTEKKVIVYEAMGVRRIGAELRQHVLKLLERWPRIKRVFVEANQAGDLWPEVLHNLPGVRVETTWSADSKEHRFAAALACYQSRRVIHADAKATRQLEEQMVSFPKAPFDDIADAAVAGVLYFLKPDQAPVVRVQTHSYV